MSRTVVFASAAEIDLEDAIDFYEFQRAGLGARFLGAIESTLDRIRIHPSAFPRDEMGIRTALVRRFPYSIRFRRMEDRVEVIAVWQERRHPDG